MYLRPASWAWSTASPRLSASRTLASLEHQWGEGRELLTDRHVLVIDEAGMIGTRQMERVLAEAQRRRAKVVLVGDVEQLQAIEAGAAFRAIVDYDVGDPRLEEVMERESRHWASDTMDDIVSKLRHIAGEKKCDPQAVESILSALHLYTSEEQPEYQGTIAALLPEGIIEALIDLGLSDKWYSEAYDIPVTNVVMVG